MIKESSNLIGQEAQLATLNQKLSQMLPFRSHYLYTKKSNMSTDSFQRY